MASAAAFRQSTSSTSPTVSPAVRFARTTRSPAFVSDHGDLARHDEVQSERRFARSRRGGRRPRTCASGTARPAPRDRAPGWPRPPATPTRGSRPTGAGSAPTARRPPPGASRPPPRAPRAGRRARIDGRVAMTLAAPGSCERSAISPKNAPAARRARTMGLPSSSAERRDTSSSPRATMYAAASSSPSRITTCPAGTVSVSNAASRSCSASLPERAEEGQRRDPRRRPRCRRRPPCGGPTRRSAPPSTRAPGP